MKRNLSIILLIVSIPIVARIFFWPSITKLVAFFQNYEAISTMLRNSGPSGWIILIILLVLQAFLAFIPGQGLMLASGYIYGFWKGLLLTWFSLTLGGQISFWLARRYGRPFAARFVSNKVLTRWDTLSSRQGVGFYIVSLFLPIFPNDAMCFVAGLGEISFRRFLVANLVGRFIATASMTFVGAYGGQIPTIVWGVIAITFVVVLIGWNILKDLILCPSANPEV